MILSNYRYDYSVSNKLNPKFDLFSFREQLFTDKTIVQENVFPNRYS